MIFEENITLVACFALSAALSVSASGSDRLFSLLIARQRSNTPRFATQHNQSYLPAGRHDKERAPQTGIALIKPACQRLIQTPGRDPINFTKQLIMLANNTISKVGSSGMNFVF